MGASSPHEMVHQGTDASGMEEWRCPVCGRQFGDRPAPGADAAPGDADRRWLRDHGIDWDGGAG